MKYKRYSGVVVPMVTPLHADFRVDTAAVGRLVRLFAQHHIDPLVLGTTGESPSIGAKESKRLLRTAVTAKSEGQLIYAGLVGNQVEELILRGKWYLEQGADAIVATLPSYYTLSPVQMEQFYLQLADGIGGPLMIYNIKATTQMSIPLDVVQRLSKHPHIVGLKDSERDEQRMHACIEMFRERDDFSYFCGWGAMGAASLLAGADGIVPSTGNVVPHLYGALYESFLKGDREQCELYQRQTDEVAVKYQSGLTLGQSLARLKELMHEQGLCGTTMMPPL